ncbi:MAG: hypothetical protein U9O98_01845 [Asgard group archaeon]|nr:hypothetical protein [Asgard group archaeon]
MEKNNLPFQVFLSYLLDIFANIPLNFQKISYNDFLLILITSCFGVWLLVLFLILLTTRLSSWLIRKAMHLLGGAYISLIVFKYDTFLGLILSLILFLILFLSLLVNSKFYLFKKILTLNRNNADKDATVLFNTISTLVIFFILFLIFHNNPLVFTAGLLVLTIADSAGEIAGRFFPFMEYKLFSKKSLSGSLAVFLFSILAFITTLFYYNYLIEINFIWIFIVGSFICTLVEACSWKWIDNLLMPFFGSLIMFWYVSVI